MNKSIVVVLSDTHCGHKLGLLSPQTQFPDYETGNLAMVSPELNETQKWIWAFYSQCVEKVKEMKGDFYILHTGDICNGNKYPEQLVSTRVSDQIAIAIEALTPWMELKPKAFRVSFGTGAHMISEESSELLVVAQLKAMYPEVDIAATGHGEIGISGAKIDYAHHGPGPGGRQWLIGNALRGYVRSLMHEAISDGEKPADLYIRGHFHQFTAESVMVQTRKAIYQSDAIIMPSLCGLSLHGRQATRSAHSIGVGLVVLEVEDGHIRVNPMIDSIDLRTRETF